jgi:pSer/pThr/pTyr-binding forkhead associated (FHA) protein
MDFAGSGELVPLGGGDSIPLERTPLVLGRRESCDICLRFPNISGRHCELFFDKGFWIVRDLNSTNGIKVNGEKIAPGGKKILAPDDTVSIGKRDYKIQYVPTDRLSRIDELMEEEEEDILGVPLLERAGLEIPRSPDRTKNNPNMPPLLWDDADNDDDDDDDD